MERRWELTIKAVRLQEVVQEAMAHVGVQEIKVRQQRLKRLQLSTSKLKHKQGRSEGEKKKRSQSRNI